MHGECAGNGNAFTLAERELVRGPVCEVSDPEDTKGLHHPVMDFALGQTRV
ncbi:hypothetical protein FQZ97_910070 [compost metagenome]